MPAKSCDCGYSDPELRYNASNNGIAWQCASCGSALSNWIAHEDPEVSHLGAPSLPPWDKSGRYRRQGELL